LHTIQFACPVDVDPKSLAKKTITTIDEFKIKLDEKPG